MISVITIDPVDARDFDDAISLERIEGRRWRLWVHIADVSHYVPPKSALDKEVRRRGNSTLSSGSRYPDVTRGVEQRVVLGFAERRPACAQRGVRADRTWRRSRPDFIHVIRSVDRYAYEEAMAILDREPQNKNGTDAAPRHRLAQKLRKARFRTGALNLDVPEHKVFLDAKGRVSEVRRIENDISHQLIEEFMLLANEAVAKEIKRRRAKAVHRIHEEPDDEKLDNLRAQAVLAGLRAGNLADQKQAGRFLASLAGHPLEDVFRIGYLRCMKRACYSTHPVGHYGLAKQDYVHFTSPIRRYADLIVHRVVYQNKNTRAPPLRRRPITFH